VHHALVNDAPVNDVLVNDVHGTFNEFEGTIKADAKDITQSSVEFSARVASIDSCESRLGTRER